MARIQACRRSTCDRTESQDEKQTIGKRDRSCTTFEAFQTGVSNSHSGTPGSMLQNVADILSTRSLPVDTVKCTHDV